jgi:hypothetical protein
MNAISTPGVDFDTSAWHPVEASMSWGRIDKALTWCKQQCAMEWRWQMIEHSSPAGAGRYVFYFQKEQDKTAFALKWI